MGGLGSFLQGFAGSMMPMMQQNKLRDMMIGQQRQTGMPSTGGVDVPYPGGPVQGPLQQGGQFQSSPLSAMYSRLRALIGG